MPGPSVKMLDVARRAGVSRATVSLAFRGSPLLREETRALVIRAAEDLGYVYNRNAANLRSSRTDIVGMVINDLTNPFFAELAVGAERVLQRAGLMIFLANTAESPERQAAVLRRMLEQGAAGIIISPAHGTAGDAFADLHAVGVPVVQAMRFIERGRASLVMPDNRRGAAEAVAHLVRNGHRRIAFAGGFQDTSVLRDRLGGYAEGLAAAGLPVDPALVFEGPPTRDFGVALASRLTGMAERASAVLAFNDVVALGLCSGLRRAGLEPGKDLAVIGFDDIDEASHAMPALTSVSVRPRALGEQAAEMLLRQISCESSGPERYTGQVRLVLRET